jgi:hypothetical protein
VQHFAVNSWLVFEKKELALVISHPGNGLSAQNRLQRFPVKAFPGTFRNSRKRLVRNPFRSFSSAALTFFAASALYIKRKKRPGFVTSNFCSAGRFENNAEYP